MFVLYLQMVLLCGFGTTGCKLSIVCDEDAGDEVGDLGTQLVYIVFLHFGRCLTSHSGLASVLLVVDAMLPDNVRDLRGRLVLIVLHNSLRFGQLDFLMRV